MAKPHHQKRPAGRPVKLRNPTQIPAAETAKLWRNAGGYYEIRYSEPDDRAGRAGKWRSKVVSTRTKDQAAAEIALKTFIAGETAAPGASASGNASKSVLTISMLISAYERYARQNNVKRSQFAKLRVIDKAIGHYDATDIEAAVQAYRDARGHLKDGSLRRDLGVLRAVLGYSTKKARLIPTNMVPVIDMPRMGPARDVWLDSRTEARVHAAAVAWYDRYREAGPYESCRARLGLFLVLALNTAARMEAIQELTWERVDFARGTIDFRVPGVVYRNKRRGVVRINNRLRPILQCAAGHSGSGKVIGRMSLAAALKVFRECFDVPALTAHVCRHTWATLAAQHGVSLWEIAKTLADSVVTVEKHYAHHSPEHLVGTLNIFDAAA